MHFERAGAETKFSTGKTIPFIGTLRYGKNERELLAGLFNLAFLKLEEK